MFKSISKLAFKAELTSRVPEYMSVAFRHAQEGCKGAVYIDAPGDVINGKVDEAKVWWPTQYRVESRPQGDPAQIRKAVEMLAKAEKPVIVSGSGVLWSEGWDEYKKFVEQTGIPFYTTPQGRGAISDEHPMMFAGGRTLAFREADVVLVLATRSNSMLTNFKAPRWNGSAKFIEINIDGKELGHNRAVELGIIADAKMALKQLIEESKGKIKPERYEKWRETLKKQDEVRAERAQVVMNTDKTPIHPARLCKELTEAMPRDAYLIVDGHEIMGFSRQMMPIYNPRHIVNAGPMGCMGVGVPFGLGVQAAHPDKPVVVLCGDGAFGWNGMEVDTAVRHKLPIKIIISNNAGFTGRGTYGMTGRELGWQRYDKVMEAFGGYGEWVEDPAKIRPAIERALKHNGPALVNVKTDPEARASSAVGF